MPVTLEAVSTPVAKDFSDLEKVYADYPDGLRWPDLQQKAQENPHFKLYAGRFNDHFLGAISVLQNGDQATLNHLCVRDITRGRHVARDILRLLLQTHPAKTFQISPCQDNPALHHLLENAGFVKTGGTYILNR